MACGSPCRGLVRSVYLDTGKVAGPGLPGAFARDVAGVGDDRVAFLQAAENFQAIAVVAAHLDLLQVQVVVGANDGDLRSVGANNQSVAGDQKGSRCGRC